MNSIEAQRYARVAGVLVLISLFAGGFGEAFVPGKLIMPGDFHETGLKVAASLGLFRAGFVSYMVEAACDLSLISCVFCRFVGCLGVATRLSLQGFRELAH